MTEPSRPHARRRGDPTAGISRLVVDMDNVLGALPRSGTSLSPVSLLGRIRAIVPPGTTVELVFDGPPSRGSVRPASGVVARYAAPRSADEVILDVVRAFGVPRPGDESSVLVVSDDRELRDAAVRLGATTAGTRWLIGRAERTSVGPPSVGRARPPATPGVERDADGPGWRPGRGATAKRGNPRRPGKGRGGRVGRDPR